MKRRLSPWVVFIGFFLLLGLGATRYGKAADMTLISLRLITVFILSILAVRESWKYFQRNDPEHSTERTDTLLQRCRRWYRGEA